MSQIIKKELFLANRIMMQEICISGNINTPSHYFQSVTNCQYSEERNRSIMIHHPNKSGSREPAKPKYGRSKQHDIFDKRVIIYWTLFRTWPT